MGFLHLQDVRDRLDSAGGISERLDAVETSEGSVLREAFVEVDDSSKGVGSREGATSYYHVLLEDWDTAKGNARWFAAEWTPIGRRDRDTLESFDRARNPLGYNYVVVSSRHMAGDLSKVEEKGSRYVSEIASSFQEYFRDDNFLHFDLVDSEASRPLRDDYRNAIESASQLGIPATSE